MITFAQFCEHEGLDASTQQAMDEFDTYRRNLELFRSAMTCAGMDIADPQDLIAEEAAQ